MDSKSVLTLTAKQLQELLSERQLTCMGVIELYLAQIQRHNKSGMRLNAVIETAPINSLREQADMLDAERAAGKLRSKLHGIPVIVKDNICTPSLQMRTTLGTLALRDCVGTKDGVVVDRLRKAGSVIIGKANLSELGNMKGAQITSGWSPIGGQTPMGSSSGSAVSVAAGFSPIAIGTETDGSVCQPATRAALYAMKATCQTIDGKGMQAAVPSMDSPGGFARTAYDLATLMSVLLDDERIAEPLPGSWDGITIGLLDPKTWIFPESYCEPIEQVQRQTIGALYKACDEIRAAGGRVVDASLPFMDDLWKQYDVIPASDLMVQEIRPAFETFLRDDLQAPIKTIKEMIEFNKAHSDVELPPGKDNQKQLEAAFECKMTKEEHDRAFPKTRGAARDAVQKSLSSAQADVLIAPGDGLLSSIAAAAGYPIANVPLGFVDYNGRAHGVHMLCPENGERKMLQVMSAWEKTFPEAARPPPMLENWHDDE